ARHLDRYAVARTDPSSNRAPGGQALACAGNGTGGKFGDSACRSANRNRYVIKLRAAAKTAVCLFKVFPMLPSRPIEWVTQRPLVEHLSYHTSHGDAEGDL